MTTADLGPFLNKPSTARPMAFRQGVVVSWNTATAENVILVGEELLTNLPILNTSEASILAAGDVVGIITSGATWAILGRFTVPGTPEAASAISAITNRIVAAADAAEGTRNSNVYGDLTGAAVGPSVTVTVGASGRALVFWSANIGQYDTFQTHSSGDVSVAVSGATTRAAAAAYSLGLSIQSGGGSTNAKFGQWTLAHLFTGLNPGVTTFTLKYQVPYGTPAVPVRYSQREIVAFVL